MRYGDVQRLGPEHIQGDTIRIITEKNRKGVTIPFLPPARAIWKKYEGKLPKISNQKMNKYVKELCEVVSIDTEIVTVDYRGVERIEKTMPKFKLIGSHSAKRSFVTTMRQRGVSVETLMVITGNNRKTIEKYILHTEEDAVRELTEAWT